MLIVLRILKQVIRRLIIGLLCFVVIGMLAPLVIGGGGGLLCWGPSPYLNRVLFTLL
jgi:hypothetical protein